MNMSEMVKEVARECPCLSQREIRQVLRVALKQMDKRSVGEVVRFIRRY